ncbi:HAMP domain-containing histidine kinase [Echinicola sp. CAU 1574]|uniref:histidine kinase n=1 Tax=Echinicola arenosa TaxID=2774144 RepID=A0ABR9AF95_9BACT|nr:HAMP domain-containing sensor histidine kinase [Echinicola arenosa]MBD8487333.1 HAMP domain-containing histidine kinase [Echinicola arenosa]
MKLLNQSLKYLSLSILMIVTIWSVIFYLNMLSEIKSSIDEGLENYKRLIILNAAEDSTILTKKYFDESFFTIQEISREQALSTKDRYFDTELYMQDADDQAPEVEPVRMLTTAFEMNGSYYELKVANSMVEEDDLIQELLWDVVWLYVVLILGVVIINNIVLRSLWKPFYDFLQQLKNYRLGRSKQFPEVRTQTREFVDLQEAVNTLLKRSVATFEQQKEFIGNASHELQTPLAVVSNKLELMLEEESLSASQLENIAEIFQTIQQLVRLNKTLLLLSKIDNKQFLENESVAIHEVISVNIEKLIDFSTFINIAVSSSEMEPIAVQMDFSLANIVVANLLKNAIFHNHEKGNVNISLKAGVLSIANTGNPNPLDVEKIFQRFQKFDSNKGAGLGLAIVKAICELYGFEVSYRFENGLHLFEVNFNTN